MKSTVAGWDRIEPFVEATPEFIDKAMANRPGTPRTRDIPANDTGRRR
jgi:hypothetical protein